MSDTPLTSTLPAQRTRRLRAPQVLVICGVVLIVLVLAVRWAVSEQTFAWDVWAAHVGMAHKPWLVWALTRVYQQVGRPLVAVGEVLAMLAWLWRVGRYRAAGGLVVALMASVVNGLIKIICGPTPLWLVLPHHVGTNFPSGVVTFMTACGGYLALVGWRRGRRVAPVSLVLVIFGAGPARVLGGQHLISDVCASYMLGGAWLIAAYLYIVRTDLLPVRSRAFAVRAAVGAAVTLPTLVTEPLSCVRGTLPQRAVHSERFTHAVPSLSESAKAGSTGQRLGQEAAVSGGAVP